MSDPVDDEGIRDFLELAEKNRELLRQIMIVVPARPHDGLAIELTKQLTRWFAVGVNWTSLTDPMAGFVEMTRAHIAYTFMTEYPEKKYLLMIDNDTLPTLMLPLTLVRHEAPVMGACIPGIGFGGRMILCFTRRDVTGTNRFIEQFGDDRIPATGVLDVPHVGTGAMMIRRDVLEAFNWSKQANGHWDIPFLVPDEIRQAGATAGQMVKGEDVWFCEQARAKGYSVQVDLEAHCGHLKTIRLDFPPNLRDPSLTAEEWLTPRAGQEVP